MTRSHPETWKVFVPLGLDGQPLMRWMGADEGQMLWLKLMAQIAPEAAVDFGWTEFSSLFFWFMLLC